MADTPRQRRLRNDLAALEQLRAESSILDFIAYGNPPEAYRLYFKGRGLHRPSNANSPQPREFHEIAMTLGATYPRSAPGLRWETPVFHPNVSQSGVVCIGGFGTFWSPGIRMDQLCEMLWDMVRYANFDPQSAYNRPAADWAKLQPRHRFPFDRRVLRDRIVSGEVAVEQIPTASPLDVFTVPAARPEAAPAEGAPTETANEEIVIVQEVVVAELVDENEPELLYIE